MKKRRTELDDLLETPKNRSFGNIVFILFLVAVFSVTGYVTWAKYDLLGKKEKLETSIKALESEEKKQIEKEGYSKSLAIKNAQNTLEKARNYRINWSNIYRDVLSLERGTITFYNFSADREKVFNVNGLALSMDNISSLLTLLKKDPKFKDPFVSQIMEVQKDNEKAFSFILSFQYIGNDYQKKLKIKR